MMKTDLRNYFLQKTKQPMVWNEFGDNVVGQAITSEENGYQFQ